MNAKELANKLAKVPATCQITTNSYMSSEINHAYLIIINGALADNNYEVLLVDDPEAKDMYMDFIYEEYSKDQVHIEEI